jgi:hypothetical protein
VKWVGNHETYLTGTVKMHECDSWNRSNHRLPFRRLAHPLAVSGSREADLAEGDIVDAERTQESESWKSF